MDSEHDSVKSHTESEEEDLGCYFLQPSSAPYNITERVQQANVDLFNSQSHHNTEKPARVKFREELISYEPDLTDDDVNSIESDRTDLSVDTRSPVLEYKTTINEEDVSLFDIDGELDEDLEEVLEEVASDSECEPEITVNTKVEKSEEKVDATVSNRKDSSRRAKTSKSKVAFLSPKEVNCRDHCIDKLDHDLSMYIKKLDIQEKSLPPLQLLQRKCCDQTKNKIHQNLPHYNGLRSEYGLSSRQLEMREKQKELLKNRDVLRQKLMEEFRKRKMQQNEEVFCQWLKEVSKRKSEKKSTKKRAASAKESRTTVNKTEKKERPKTANAFIPKIKARKKPRPQSSTANARVYIEVSKKCLEKHLRIGDLTITNSKLFPRNVHIITIS